MHLFLQIHECCLIQHEFYKCLHIELLLELVLSQVPESNKNKYGYDTIFKTHKSLIPNRW